MFKSHGTNPEIEDLESYFEYHAMFCSANFLLEKEVIFKEDLIRIYGERPFDPKDLVKKK